MAHTFIADDFKQYVDNNWCESNISKPSTITVTNFDRERRFQGYINEAVIIHRGQIQYIPIDVGYRSKAWATSVLIYSDSGASQVEDLIIEFNRIINEWENNGGGTFITGSLSFQSVDTVVFDNVSSMAAVGELSFLSHMEARNT